MRPILRGGRAPRLLRPEERERVGVLGGDALHLELVEGLLVVELVAGARLLRQAGAPLQLREELLEVVDELGLRRVDVQRRRRVVAPPASV